MEINKSDILNDYRIVVESRQASLLGRKETLTGKAKFGIFGDGKELPQVVLAKFFQNGDWRSGYYRDQTLMFATGMMPLKMFFSQLYGDTDIAQNPNTGGRMMNNHFVTPNINNDGSWRNIVQQKNTSADMSPTAGQMPRLVGLALASKMFKNVQELKQFNELSNNGNEVAFGTIGDSSTSEGHFFEAINAACVLQIPMAMSVWDDGYGISVPKKYQTTKESISEILSGFEKKENTNGLKIFKVKGWDYEALYNTYQEGILYCRENHVPVLFHVLELTQPQGHSTSGSHERYKSKERLEWEVEFDCNKKFKEWILNNKVATVEELEEIEKKAIETVKSVKKEAWGDFQNPILKKRKNFIDSLIIKSCQCGKSDKIERIAHELSQVAEPSMKDIVSSAKRILRLICKGCHPEKQLKKMLLEWLDNEYKEGNKRYSSLLYSDTPNAALNVKEVIPVYDKEEVWINGSEVLQANYDAVFANNPKVMIFGEDVGGIGGVNQTLTGLQQKYGELRISDTGIREATIIGQGIGLAMRGLRPIAEIQYFDYLLYGLQTLSDDLATLRYRSNGTQIAPLIISTRGHRLEGIWHSGSPLSMVINSIRGIHVLVPRNMTQAAGFYNTMLASDEPALIIEPLNGYRLKERKPINIGEYKLPIGIPEILNEGNDVTIVTYGSCVRIAQEAVEQLNDFNISVELIDVQSLLPFDVNALIVESLKKTNKIVFFDEDVPGGATAFMMQKVLEEQNGYQYLDAKPKTVTGKEHRAAYGTDGDYFSNPNAEDVFEAVYELMHETNPAKYPFLYEV